jgi:sugar (pentulose or hexulose) kinase
VTGAFAAVDLGATSGRVVVGRVGPSELSISEVHRFANSPVRLVDGLHWDILGLYREVLDGLAGALRREPDLASVGVDSWAVDYGLLRGRQLLGNPYHYREERTAEAVAGVHRLMDPVELYRTNGLQFQPFNTVYQLAADQSSGLLAAADSFLLLPDLLAFWLTGRPVAERTNASTTGLFDVSTRSWDQALIERLSLPRGLFPELVEPGEHIGGLRPEVAAEVGATGAVDVVAVGSHDTASAVVAVPMLGNDAAYISSGTWSLVGLELDRPVLTEASREANFTNEGGVDGRIRYLRNVMGLWLLSESVRTWQRQGLDVSLARLLEQAEDVTADVPVIDANDARFLAPGDIPRRIEDYCNEHGLASPQSPAECVRTIVESLAAAYAAALQEAQTLSGSTVRSVHVVGGGSQNELLCQLTADRCGLPVLAGPVEATAIGNVLVQARAAGVVSGDLTSMRKLVADAFPVRVYRPRA